jgi:phasin family protein
MSISVSRCNGKETGMAVRKIGEGVPAADVAADAAFEQAAAAIAPVNEAATAAVDAAGEIVEVPKQGFERAMTTLKQGMDNAAAGYQTTQAEARNNVEKAMKTAEDMMAFGQGNVEALVKSGQIWAAGMQEIGRQFAASAQAHLDQTVSTFKALTSVRSLKEAVDLQSTLARTSMEKAVAESGKLTDASLKLAEQTFAPITARMSVAVETFGRTV